MMRLNFRHNPFMTGKMKLKSKSPAQQVASGGGANLPPPPPPPSQYTPPPVPPPPGSAPPPAMHGPLEFDQITTPGTFTVPAGMRGLGVNGDAPFLSTLSSLQNNPTYQRRVARDDIGYALKKGDAGAADLDSSKDMANLAQRVGLRRAPTEAFPEGTPISATQSMTYSTAPASTQEIVMGVDPTRTGQEVMQATSNLNKNAPMRNVLDAAGMGRIDEATGLPIEMVQAQARVQDSGRGSYRGMGAFNVRNTADIGLKESGGFDPSMVRTSTMDASYQNVPGAPNPMTKDTYSVPELEMGGRKGGVNDFGDELQGADVAAGRRTVSNEEFQRNNAINFINDEMIPQHMANTADMIGNYSGLNKAINTMDAIATAPSRALGAAAQGVVNNASYLGDAAGKHLAGAVAGMGAVTISEGEMTASGLARGAFYGIGGGIVGRMAAGSLQGGALNTMGRHLGDALGGVSKEGRVGGAANKAGEFINNAMDAMSSGASQSTNVMRTATFGGAALAGFSMGRERSHSRGMNSSRGSRF